MRKASWLTTFLVVSLTASSSFAELKGAPKGKLRHANITLDQLDKRLAEIPNVTSDRVKVKIAECEDRIKDARKDLSELPIDEPEVKTTFARIDAAEKKVAEVKGGNEQSDKAKADELAAFIAAVGDGKALEGQASVFLDLIGVASRGGASDEDLAPFPQAYADFMKFDAQWGNTGAAKKSNQASVKFSVTKDRFRQVTDARNELAQNAASRVDENIAEAKKSVASLATVKSNFVGIQMSAEKSLNDAERIGKTYDVMCKDLPGYKAGLVEKVKALRPQLEAEAAKYGERIIAENTPIANVYQGADRGALETQVRTFWKAQFPQEKLLAIRFTDTDWTRHAGFQWEQSTSAWQKYDQSVLHLIVYVEGKDPKNAVQRDATVKKRHLDGDKIGVSAYLSSGRTSPIYTVLASKLK